MDNQLALMKKLQKDPDTIAYAHNEERILFSSNVSLMMIAFTWRARGHAQSRKRRARFQSE